ncbi:MAG: glycosyltransferase family 2 protein [Paracoccaceae bacterium]
MTTLSDELTKTPVRILMATYNGAPFLKEQIQSIRDQSFNEWQLHCSDDGSTDTTTELIEELADQSEQCITVSNGPGQGFSKNFLSLVRELSDACGCVAFSDQDDVWLPNKLRRAVAALEKIPKDQPALYGAASWIWDPSNNRRRASLPIRHPPSFANALIENFATGNTMVMNQKAALLLRHAAGRIGDVFAHDWLAYALVAGYGGQVIYDDTPVLLYRQHARNEIGAGETFIKRQLRNLSVADGRYRVKIGQNLDALAANRDLLTKENQNTLDTFRAARDVSPAFVRLARIYRTGVFRQSARDSIGFYAAAFLGRV